VLTADRQPHESDRRQRLLQHQRRRQAHEAPPEPSESPIASSIGRRAPRVSGAIDLDDDLHRRRSNFNR
jgi:hypothetical protein